MNPFTEMPVATPKYVVSKSTDTSLHSPNGTLLAGGAVSEVAELDQRLDGVLTVMGSAELIRSLHAAGRRRASVA